MARAQDNVRRAQDAVDAYNRHDLDALVRFRSDDCTLTDHALGQTFHGREEIRAYLQGNFDGLPDDRFDVEELIGIGDWTVSRLSGSGTHQGEWGGIPPTSRPVRYDLCAVARWQEGQVVEEHVYYDLYGMLAQLGQVPPLTATA
jgi:steroid delta-isomerase-like uncharacterized protein